MQILHKKLLIQKFWASVTLYTLCTTQKPLFVFLCYINDVIDSSSVIPVGRFRFSIKNVNANANAFKTTLTHKYDARRDVNPLACCQPVKRSRANDLVLKKLWNVRQLVSNKQQIISLKFFSITHFFSCWTQSCLFSRCLFRYGVLREQPKHRCIRCVQWGSAWRFH